MMHRLSRRQSLSLGAVLALTVVLAILALLGQWVLFALVGVVLVAAISTLTVLILGDLRSLARESAKIRKRVGGLERKFIRYGQGQDRIRALADDVHRDFAAIRGDLQKLNSRESGVLDKVSHAERRLVGIVEALRLEIDHLAMALDREEETSAIRAELKAIREGTRTELKSLRDRLQQQTVRSSASTVTKLTAVARDETRQIEALMQLVPKVEPRAPLPPSGRWAMDARALLHLSHICRQREPRNVLELGGGTSTVWLGYLLEGTGAAITSVDHEEKFAKLTAESLSRHSLASDVAIRVAPLEPVVVGSESYNWYAPKTFDDLGDIDLLIVDGPPASAGNFARYPALAFLRHKLAPACTVVVDDSERPDEVETLARWLDEFPGFARVDDGASRLAVLTRGTTIP